GRTNVIRTERRDYRRFGVRYHSARLNDKRTDHIARDENSDSSHSSLRLLATATCFPARSNRRDIVTPTCGVPTRARTVTIHASGSGVVTRTISGKCASTESADARDTSPSSDVTSDTGVPAFSSATIWSAVSCVNP